MREMAGEVVHEFQMKEEGTVFGDTVCTAGTTADDDNMVPETFIQTMKGRIDRAQKRKLPRTYYGHYQESRVNKGRGIIYHYEPLWIECG